MALIRAMNSAISGLRAQQFRIDVVGDNLANATTTGFKAGRVNFQTLFSQTMAFGTAPQGFLGGVDPMQIGLGVGVAETSKNWTQGELETTGVTTDLGIEGSGFFIMKDISGNQVFTRDGSFGINPQNFLHNPSNGMMVQGINANLTTFTIASGSALQNVYIPVGEIQIAVATGTLGFDGNLNGGGAQALEGTVLESSVFVDGSGGPAAISSTSLTSLFRVPSTGGSDIDLALDIGDTIQVTAKKGGRTLPTQTFRIDTSPQAGDDGFGTTLGDLTSFLERALGINTGASELLISATRDDDSDPNTPGVTGVASSYVSSAGQIVGVTQVGRDFTAEGVQVGDILRFNSGQGAGQIAQVTSISGGGTTIDFTALSATMPIPNNGDMFSVHEAPRVTVGGFPSAAGTIRIAGNVGTANDLTDLEIVSSDGFSLSSFFTRQTATGESVITNATVYDTNGAAHLVEMTFVLETKGGVDPSTNSPGNTFRYFSEASDSRYVSGTTLLGSNRVVGTGTLTFSTSGQFLSQNPTASINVVLPNQGAATPLTITPDFDGLTGFASQLSQVFLLEQDGFPVGVLTDFSIGTDGLVTGIFSNGVTRSLAQIQLARFQNPQGLENLDGNNFRQAANSGPPIVGRPGTLGIGAIRSGALESSNVDFSREFTTLIIGQRAFQANARVITTADNLLEELVRLV